MSLSAKNIRYAWLFIAIICFLLYGNTLRNDYCLDDEIVTGPGNITARGFSSVKEVFTSYYQNEMGNRFDYRPLVKLSFAIENGFFGIEPGIHHFFNVVFYALCCCLLFNFLIKILSGGHLISLLICVLFIVHPAHTEVVASLKNRDVMLVFIFSMLAAIQLARLFENNNLHWGRLALALFFFYLAMLSKRDAIAFMFILPLVLYLRFKPKMTFGFVAFSLIISAYILLKLTATALVEGDDEHRAFEYFENPAFESKNIPARTAAFFNSAGFYFIQNFFPYRLLSYYGYRQIDVLSFGSLHFFAGLIGFGTSAFLFFKSFKKNFILACGLIFLIGGMALYLNLLRPVPGIVADRFVFVSSVGACILIVYVLSIVFKFDVTKGISFSHIPPGAKNSLYVIALCAGIFTIIRNTQWKDRESLFAKDSAKAPLSVKLQSLYALELIRQFRSTENTTAGNKKELAEKAMAALRKSLEVYPDYANSQSNLAYLILATNGSAEEALSLLKNAIKLKEHTSEIYFNYADALDRAGNTEEAEKNLLLAISKDKAFKPAYDLLVNVAWKNKRLSTAIDAHKRLLKDGTQKEFVFLNLGNCYARMQDTGNAVIYYDSAFVRNTSNQQLGRFLFKYYTSKGKAAEAQRIQGLAGK